MNSNTAKSIHQLSFSVLCTFIRFVCCFFHLFHSLPENYSQQVRAGCFDPNEKVFLNFWNSLYWLAFFVWNFYSLTINGADYNLCFHFFFISFSSVDKDKQIINFTFASFRHSSSSKRLELVNAVEDCLASVQLFDEARSMCSLEVSYLVSILVSFYKKSFLTCPFFAAYFALHMVRLFTRSNGNRYCYSLLI